MKKYKLNTTKETFTEDIKKALDDIITRKDEKAEFMIATTNIGVIVSGEDGAICFGLMRLIETIKEQNVISKDIIESIVKLALTDDDKEKAKLMLKMMKDKLEEVQNEI